MKDGTSRVKVYGWVKVCGEMYGGAEGDKQKLVICEEIRFGRCGGQRKRELF